LAAALNQGFTDEGWKDTVLVLPGESVQVLMRFPQFKGLFLYHCHILEHEDMGMMRNFRLS
jgi:blue copper oxidase